MHINDVSGQVVDAAIKVHSVLGPGLLSQLKLSDHRVGLLINFTSHDSKMESSGW